MKQPPDPQRIRQLVDRYWRRQARLGPFRRPEQATTAADQSHNKVAAEADAADRALLEIFSDPKLPRFPLRHWWVFDPEKQQFVRDEIDLMLEQAFKEAFGIEDDPDLDQPRPARTDKHGKPPG
jgi:hypothetical protein